MRPKSECMKQLGQGIRYCAILLVFVWMVLGCKRTLEPIGINDVFNATAAKEWYYRVFKKSNEWKTSEKAGKQLPVWTKGIYQKIGNVEIVEFPLISVKATVAVPSENISVTHSKRIAEGVISRIVFIRLGTGEIRVRELDYIPDIDYLKTKDYDISRQTLTQKGQDFSGMLMVRKWGGEWISSWKLKTGNLVKKAKHLISAESPQYRASTGTCTVLVTEYERDCQWRTLGDVIEYVCGEWTTTGVTFMIEFPCDGDEPPCSSSMSSEECACYVYGAGCNDDSDDNDGDNGCSNLPTPAEVLAGGSPESVLVDAEVEPDIIDAFGDTSRSWKGRWNFYRGTFLTYSWCYRSFDVGLHKKVAGVWRWVSISHVSHSQVGTSPFTTTCTMTGSTPTIDPDGQMAEMKLEYEVKVCIECAGVAFGCNAENATSWKRFSVN